MSERVHMTAPDGRTFTFKELGYESNLARCRKGIALAREEYDKRVQLSLF